MPIEMDARARVIAKLNREIGNDANNLYKTKHIIDEYRQEYKIVESKLRLENHEVESEIKTRIREYENLVEAVEIQAAKIDGYNEEISPALCEYGDIMKGISVPMKKLNHLEHLIEYYRVLDDITGISNAIKASVNSKDEHKLTGFYLSLCGERNSTNSVIGRLENVTAPNLKSFANNTAQYWYDVLLDKFSNDFESLLKSLKWPSVNEIINPSKDITNKLGLLAEYLFLMKPPGHISDELVMIRPSVFCPQISTPVQLLLKAFRQRFFYHFSGLKQTNRLDKPEWYFTQILSWAKEFHIFVGMYFQDAAIHSGHEDLNVRLEFVRGLVQFIIEKLCHDIEEISQDNRLFAHLIDEILSFEHELRDIMQYPSTFPSALTVLTQPFYILKWLNAEDNFSTTQMDKMLTTDNPWEFIDPDNIEELKIPKCADQFIRLLDAIRERYCILSQPRHQFEFLNLQLELIDSFRARLVQLHNTTVDSTMILNAINYVVSVLREWGENVHYLHLNVTKTDLNTDDEVASVFDESINEFEHWKNRIISELASKIVDDIKAKSMSYRHDDWISMKLPNPKDSFSLSPSASEMFQIMVNNLHSLESDLSRNIFNNILRLIAYKLDSFFIDSMIMNTKFSSGGGVQFNFDMTRNLFPLFGQYMQRPHLLFKRVHDACKLLTMSEGEAQQIYGKLKKTNRGIGGDSLDEETKNDLIKIGIIVMFDDRALEILERRKIAWWHH